MPIKLFISELLAYETEFNDFAEKNEIISTRMPEQFVPTSSMEKDEQGNPVEVKTIFIVCIVEYKPKPHIK